MNRSPCRPILNSRRRLTWRSRSVGQHRVNVGGSSLRNAIYPSQTRVRSRPQFLGAAVLDSSGVRDNVKQGVAVVARDPYRLTPLPQQEGAPKCIVPIAVEGPVS